MLNLNTHTKKVLTSFLQFCNGCLVPFAYHYSYWIFFYSNVLWECLPHFFPTFVDETYLHLIVVSMHHLHFFSNGFSLVLSLSLVLFFSLSFVLLVGGASGNICPSFLLLLQQTDDSNCVLLPIQHITYNFYHSFFLFRISLLFPFFANRNRSFLSSFNVLVCPLARWYIIALSLCLTRKVLNAPGIDIVFFFTALNVTTWRISLIIDNKLL